MVLRYPVILKLLLSVIASKGTTQAVTAQDRFVKIEIS